MAPLYLLSAALAWVGRQGTRAVAALVFIGVAAPPLDALLKPYVAEAIFLLLCVSFLRVDPIILRQQLRRPGVVIAVTLWTMLVVPIAFGCGCLALGLDHSSPALFLGLMLQAIASPMMAAPAFAALMGLDATLVLVALVASTALLPLTAPIFAYLFVGSALTLSPVALGTKLFGILAGAAATAAALAWLLGRSAIERHREVIDGCNVLILFVFVGAVMENVALHFAAEPMRMIALTGLAFAAILVVLALTTAVFAKTGRGRAMAIGLMASQRNMGLMLAATGRDLPELVWVYFALCQFPIYLLPQLLKPVARRFVLAAAVPRAG